MNKKIFACFMSVLLVIFCLPVGAGAAAGFYDVPNGAWYAAAVRDLVNRGIMSGTGNGGFNPNGSLTRGQFATMLARAALPDSELEKYKYRGVFSDVGTGHWANPYVNWASENGVVHGSGDRRFNPGGRLTRQDMAVMLVNYAKAMGIGIPPVRGSVGFGDSYAISGYAKSAVDACVRAGILNGDGSYFRPGSASKRCDAAQMFSTFLKVGKAPEYKVIRRRVEGVSVAAVEFDPGRYTPDIVMGRNVIDGGESIGSIVERTGAKIAVNGAFFDFNSYMPYATIVKNGRLVSTFNRFSPAKSAIVMDSSGRFSIENFTTNVTLTASYGDGTSRTAGGVAVNVWPSSKTDSTRIIYTRDWSGTLGFKPKYAVRVRNDGYVTAVYRDQDVTIDWDSYLLVQQGERKYQNEFIASIKEGDYIQRDISYDGSRTQDIKLCLGVGPKVVQDGWMYGDASTYRAEGLDQINNFSADSRVCFGIKPDGRLLILAANTSLPKLSDIMVSLGCYSAVNLDGGGSANLYVEGAYYTGPRSRPMNNVLVFK